MRIGDIAPDFRLPLHTGEDFQLSRCRNKQNVVLFFYPRDFTSGCTKESCLFSSHSEDIEQLDARIIGISSDTLASHRDFAAKYRLAYPLASDVEKIVSRAYDALWPFGIAVRRVTYVIDREGVVRGKKHEELRIDRHWEYVLNVLRELKQTAKHE